MSRTAVFVDLDRTLLAGASGPVLTAALRAAGVVSSRRLPGEDLLYRLFDRIGENLPSMVLARQAPAVMVGRDRDAVRAAARGATEQLVALMRNGAHDMLREHRDAGRRLVLATTTPGDFIEHFAETVGFDEIVATRYATDDDGRYTGALDGAFTWAAGKLRAVREWALGAGVDMGESWAYSDSFYDAPLLESVGNPRVVSPDARLAALAAARRWPVVDLDSPGSTPRPPIGTRDVQRVGLAFARPEVFPFVRFDIEGVERIPRRGPVILVANHRSYFDVFAVALVVSQSGRTVRFLGKKEVFDAPVIGQVASLLGGIRVDRASGSDEPLAAAAAALAEGEMVAIMPQGTIPRGRPFFSPELRGRWGAARLAAMSGATVVPVGLWGTERVWPRSARLPNLASVFDPPLVRIRVGEPMAIDAMLDVETNTTRVMSAISDLLPAEARIAREPNEAELRRTFPSNYRGDPSAEDTRRPGTD